MSLIILVRHGESESNVKHVLSDYLEKYPLTKKGRRQVMVSGKSLGKLKIDKFFSSPILRTRQTAKILLKNARLDLTFKIDKRLIERNFGSLSGSIKKENLWKLTSNNKIESFNSIQKRMISFIKEQSQYNVVVAVTHHDPIVSVLAYALNLDELGSYSFRPTYASINILELTNGNLKLILSGLPYLTEGAIKKIPKRYR